MGKRSLGEKDRRDDVQRVEWSAVQCSAVRSDTQYGTRHINESIVYSTRVPLFLRLSSFPQMRIDCVRLLCTLAGGLDLGWECG